MYFIATRSTFRQRGPSYAIIGFNTNTAIMNKVEGTAARNLFKTGYADS